MVRDRPQKSVLQPVQPFKPRGARNEGRPLVPTDFLDKKVMRRIAEHIDGMQPKGQPKAVSSIGKSNINP